MRVKETVEYFANDGTQFTDKRKCRAYEINKYYKKLFDKGEILFFNSDGTEMSIDDVADWPGIEDCYVKCETEKAVKALYGICEMHYDNFSSWLRRDCPPHGSQWEEEYYLRLYRAGIYRCKYDCDEKWFECKRISLWDKFKLDAVPYLAAENKVCVSFPYKEQICQVILPEETAIGEAIRFIFHKEFSDVISEKHEELYGDDNRWVTKLHCNDSIIAEEELDLPLKEYTDEHSHRQIWLFFQSESDEA